jgi:hypothetical protein
VHCLSQVTVFGKSLRNGEEVRCVWTSEEACGETNCTKGVFVDKLYRRSERMYCAAPSFPAQSPVSTGGRGQRDALLFIASNGYDLSPDQVSKRALYSVRHP